MIKQHPRIVREKKTIEKMVHIYCKAHHDAKENESCSECTEFLDYAFLRLDKCPFQQEKSTCGKCLVHCYQPQMRNKAKEIMRYAGPRMLLYSPRLALQHLFDGRKKPLTLKELKEKKAKEATWQNMRPDNNF